MHVCFTRTAIQLRDHVDEAGLVQLPCNESISIQFLQNVAFSFDSKYKTLTQKLSHRSTQRRLNSFQVLQFRIINSIL